jgi:hypothetical protein
MSRISIVYFLFAVLFCGNAVSQTKIYYENGDVYTLSVNERVFVSNQPNVYVRTTYESTGHIYFRAINEIDRVDYQPQPWDYMTPASPEWCANYEPYTSGYTWDDQLYERYCPDS